MRRTATLLLLLALALAACGGNDKEVHGVDTSDPKAVAEATIRALYDCGEEGGGLEYDLTLPSQRTVSRQRALRNEQESGCRPERIPEHDLLLQGEYGERRFYEVSMPGDQGGRLVVANTPDGWRLDGERSELSR